MLFSWTSLANFYLAFFFLVSSATAQPKTDAFNFLASGAGRIVFEVLLKFYIAIIFVVLICSLGNRPQGSKWTYWLAVISFGIINCLTLWCAAYTVYLAVPHSLKEWQNFEKLLNNKTFRDIAISFAATYGLYFISSFMHFEPWHMFTSFLQYLFFLPSYVNILMMYAMCNLHDLGWGTKGDNGSSKDLGGAKKVVKDGKEVLEVEVPTVKEDIDSLWQASRATLRQKPPAEKEHRDAATKQLDHDRNSRTNVVLTWIGTNMAMIIIFTSDGFLTFVQKHFTDVPGSVFNPYLSFLFFALAGLSAIRFAGSALYLILRLFGH
jgi:chitin synthase